MIERIKNIDIFSPYIVVFAILVFLGMGYFGSFNYRFDSPLSIEAILIILYSVLIFIIGVLIIGKFFVFKKSNISQFNFTLSISKLLNEKLLVFLVLIALSLQIINLIYLGGIPLFNSILKANATTNLWRISYILFLPSINILIAKYYNKKYFLLILFALLLYTLNGYRTSIIAILISLFITFYYLGNLNRKIAIIFIVLMGGLGLAIGFIASQSIVGQNWMLNPLELVFYRAGFTLKVFDNIVPLAGSTGGHILAMVFSSGSPRTFIGEYVLHYHALITSTLFGPVYLDFGLIGLTIQMFFFGSFLKLIYMIQKNIKGLAIGIYAIILAHILIWIETGPTDIMIWFFLLLGCILIVFNKDKIQFKGINS
ncbi:MAG: oligosaccharide repeat unit polymerase family protein [Methanobacteriaceae archaeon]|jgi:oligosaccharide repeat unit polymerase|nr:oligosaccharide repeat unit polymerase family protein [Methanobacteriaceae archaeon]